MGEPRIAIPVTLHFGVRYLLRTGLLERIASFARPVVLVAWDDPALETELVEAGAEVRRLPHARLGAEYQHRRSVLNLWYASRLASPSEPIDRRRADARRTRRVRIARALRLAGYRAQLALPGGVRRNLRADAAAAARDTNFDEYRAILRACAADAVFSFTPFLPEDELLARAAAADGIPLVTAILSFDNITTRGWMPVRFDRYLLWNRYNERELLRGYPSVEARDIRIVGAPQFDFYWDESYLWDERRWRAQVGLPAARPVILYGGGAESIVPHEPHFVHQLDEAIERGEIPGRPVVLFRRHPIDPPERWATVRQRSRHVVFDEPWDAASVGGRVSIGRADIERLASTLRHSQVHVNVSSTLTVDGAIFDRPQIGPAYDDRVEAGRRYDRITRELYEREHFRPITDSGALDVAYDRDAMIAGIRAALADPDARRAQRRAMVRDLCTFADGASAARVADALREFVGAPAPLACAAQS